MVDMFSHMFSHWGFQSPAMLFALLSLAIPVVIHILSKSRGNLVHIGDIRFIVSKKLKRMTEIRLVERLLLVLRLLLLILITLLLAYFFVKNEGAIPDKNMILVTQAWLDNADAAEKKVLLRQTQRSENRVLLLGQAGKEVTKLTADVINAPPSLSNDAAHKVAPYTNVWQQVRHALPAPMPSNVTVYATNNLSQFIGEKPREMDKIDWRIKSLPVDKLLLSLSEPIKVLVISSKNRRDDVAYIRAALTALSEDTLSALDVVYEEIVNLEGTTDSSVMFNAQDIIFYLADSPPTAALERAVEAGARVILDASTQQKQVNTWLGAHLYLNETSLPDLYGSIALHQIGVPSALSKSDQISAPQVIWKTDNGLALLVTQKVGKGEIYSLYSRFNPDWSNWVLTSHFPYDLAELVSTGAVNTKLTENFLAKTRLSAEQISRQISLASEETNTKDSDGSVMGVLDLKDKSPLVLLLFLTVLIFCIERLLSEATLTRQAVRKDDDDK